MPRNSNFVAAYSLNPQHQPRFDEPEGHWFQLQRRFNRWGGGHTWERLADKLSFALKGASAYWSEAPDPQRLKVFCRVLDELRSQVEAEGLAPD